MISKNKKHSPSCGHDKQKVFQSLFQQLKYKLESLLAVDFLGTYQMYIISQCIPSSDIREPDTKASTGQDQTSGSSECAMLRAAG